MRPGQACEKVMSSSWDRVVVCVTVACINVLHCSALDINITITAAGLRANAYAQ
jgi:hypothetical protein